MGNGECLYVNLLCPYTHLYLYTYSHSSDGNWNDLKRICHTWKGRNSQIGFRKSSLLAASLHDFLQQTFEVGMKAKASPDILGQVEMFLAALEREGGEIEEFLKSQYLL